MRLNVPLDPTSAKLLQMASLEVYGFCPMYLGHKEVQFCRTPQQILTITAGLWVLEWQGNTYRSRSADVLFRNAEVDGFDRNHVSLLSGSANGLLVQIALNGPALRSGPFNSNESDLFSQGCAWLVACAEVGVSQWRVTPHGRNHIHRFLNMRP